MTVVMNDQNLLIIFRQAIARKQNKRICQATLLAP